MKVTLCANGDWANVGYEYAEALKAVGIDAQLLKLREHSFNYEPTGEIVSLGIMKDEIMGSDIVVIMHSDAGLLKILQEDNILPTLKRFGGKVVAFHGGTVYRQDSEKFHKDYGQLIDATIIQTFDLLNKGAKNEHWILPPVDLDRIQPDFSFKNKDKLVLGHFPSGVRWKNTTLISNTIESLDQSKVEYLHSLEKIDNHSNLLRINECDIYVEHQQYTQRGKIYGEFGVACLEAAALGKIVVTCSNAKNEYERQYDNCPLVISNSPERLRRVLDILINYMPGNSLLVLKKRHRRWVETYHSYRAIGKRLKALCESLVA